MKTFAWDLGYDCNYRCSYCFFSATGWDNIKKQHGNNRTIDEIYNAWKNIFNRYGPVKLYITGGEPFLYPGFSEIIHRLSKLHFIHITTNLSQSLSEFIAKNSPSRIEINSTFHPFNSDPLQFSEQVLKLRKAGFSCGACFLAHPKQLREMLNYKKYFKSRSIEMALTIFRGKYKGKEYPLSYSKEELSSIGIIDQWRPVKDDLIILCENKHAIPAVFLEGAGALEFEACSDEDTRCNAGRDFAVISVDGVARRCGRLQRSELGNIFKGGVELLSSPLHCAEKKCADRVRDTLPGRRR